MFPQRLGFHVVFGISMMAVLSRCNEFKQIDLIEALDSCCKIGAQLKSCSEKGINGSFHDQPVGLCRTTMKMCCLLSQNNLQCDKRDMDFIIKSSDGFCGKTFPTKYSSCCVACQVGDEFSMESDFCGSSDIPNFENLADSSLRNLISECCERKKRISRNIKLEKMVSCSGGFYFNTKSSKCVDINECEIENNGCEDSQVCENRVGSYACVPGNVCRNGFSFDVESLTCKKDCNKLVTIERIENLSPKFHDLDFSASSNVSVSMKRYLNCSKGFLYHENKQKCVDFDECRANRKVCDHFCQNTEGSFRCQCRRGYRIDPKNRTTCIDLNECVLHKNLCSHGCKNFKGFFRCQCPKGFKLGPNRKLCEDINECVERRGTCGKQICNNLIGSHICHTPECPQGYKTYHLTRRNDFNKCVRRPCKNSDFMCLNKPKYLTFKNITLLANPKNVKRGVVLHNVDLSKLKIPVMFSLKVITEAKKFGVVGADTRDFEIKKFPTRALILMKNFIGPQKVKLIVDMKTESAKVIENFLIDLTVQNRNLT